MNKTDIIDKAMERLDKLCQTLDLVEARKILQEVIPEEKKCEDCIVGIDYSSCEGGWPLKESKDKGINQMNKDKFNFCPICGRKL